MGEQELLDLALRVTADAADTALAMREQAITQVDTKSSRTDAVTAADRAVERQIVAAIRRARPADSVLGEELGDSGDAAPDTVRWIIDPIDGTVNYLYGLPYWAVSVAAEVGGAVVAGVVHNPATGAVYHALAGRGAWRDGRRLSCSTVDDLSMALVATGFGYAAQRRAHQGRVLAQLVPKVRDIRRLGSAALDLCAAAEGVVDAFYEKGLAPWDLAAGSLIASEAGLLVTGLSGRPAGPTMVLAAPEVLHRQLDDLLTAAGADIGP